MAELPARLPDAQVVRGDPYAMKFIFTNPDRSVRDVSLCQWEITSALPFDIDTSNAGSGVVIFSATKENTGDLSMPPLIRWDIYEKNLWNRTILSGRFVMADQAVGAVEVSA